MARKLDIVVLEYSIHLTVDVKVNPLIEAGVFGRSNSMQWVDIYRK